MEKLMDYVIGFGYMLVVVATLFIFYVAIPALIIYALIHLTTGWL